MQGVQNAMHVVWNAYHHLTAIKKTNNTPNIQHQIYIIFCHSLSIDDVAMFVIIIIVHPPEDIELMKCLSYKFCRLCEKGKHILSVIHYTESESESESYIQYMGQCVFNLPISHMMIERIYTMSYYHQHIGIMNYCSLFRVTSLSIGMRCMSIYILTNTYVFITRLLLLNIGTSSTVPVTTIPIYCPSRHYGAMKCRCYSNTLVGDAVCHMLKYVLHPQIF